MLYSHIHMNIHHIFFSLNLLDRFLLFLLSLLFYSSINFCTFIEEGYENLSEKFMKNGGQVEKF